MGRVAWHKNWARVRVEPCDRARLRRALQWAVFTVHSSVIEAERSFAFYDATGTFRTPCLQAARARALSDVDAFCDALHWRTFSRASRAAKLEAIVKAVCGLSYAKAAFGLTIAGMVDLACLDVHALRRALGVETRQWRTPEAYLRDVGVAFGGVRGSGKRQWSRYEQWVPAFRRTQHETVFDILLCNKRVSNASIYSRRK